MKYRYFNQQSGTWSERLYTPVELSKDAFFDDDTVLATEDGQQILTYGQVFKNRTKREKYTREKYTNQPSAVPAASNNADQKYTNYWIRTLCKFTWFSMILSVSSSICIGVMSIIFDKSVITIFLFGGILGLIIALFALFCVEGAAREASEK